MIAEKFNGTPAILDEHGNVEMEAVPPEYDVVIANSVAYEGIDLHPHLHRASRRSAMGNRHASAAQRTRRPPGQYPGRDWNPLLHLAGLHRRGAAHIILGKLTWMKDIFAGAERGDKQSGGRAQAEPRRAGGVLYSPEELSTLRPDGQKREIEDRRAARRRAWTLIKRIYEHQGSKGKVRRRAGTG